MPRFTIHNTEGYSATDLDTLNSMFNDAVYLPPAARAAMDDITLKSWEDHTAEMVLVDYDARND